MHFLLPFSTFTVVNLAEEKSFEGEGSSRSRGVLSNVTDAPLDYTSDSCYGPLARSNSLNLWDYLHKYEPSFHWASV